VNKCPNPHCPQVHNKHKKLQTTHTSSKPPSYASVVATTTPPGHIDQPSTIVHGCSARVIKSTSFIPQSTTNIIDTPNTVSLIPSPQTFITDFYSDDTSSTSTTPDSLNHPHLHRAFMVTTTALTAHTKKITLTDPSLADLGHPSDLNNCLPDSGATQHMTPRLADLFDIEEDLNMGVEVADGHIIHYAIIGKITINMFDVSLTKSQPAYPLSFKEDVLLLSNNLKMVVDAEILSSTIKAESQRS
jgi:hypothetical protein